MGRRLFPFRLVLFSILIAAICCSFSFVSLSQTEKSAPGSGRKPPEAKTSAGSSKGKTLEPRVLHARAEVRRLTELRILPSTVRLVGPIASQRLVVEGRFADGHEEDLTTEAKLSSSNPQVAQLDNLPSVVAAGDGRATLRANYRGSSATTEVVVENFTKNYSYTFRNEVLPVMTKVGCNSGPCHGALAGKNGFKLTLRGYDPEADYYTLTRQALARRTERLEPAKSLILLKPTLTIPHGGGRRFGVGSPEYRIMSGWIAQGMPPPLDSDARVGDLEVLPREVSLLPGAEQQILVRAHYSDGSMKDVTRWAKFSSGDMSVANVDDLGHVKMTGYGEAPVTVWYQSRVSFARLSVPFPVSIDPAVFKAPVPAHPALAHRDG